ncbi:putative glycoside hydrolase [Colwellia sp. UCD-KL20]|uniref:putative glycoside hydrolase n=1 Tax=Colwellia sp. UCD-KL20 TaxID=1917165 RepID=UPI00097029AF|nr:putative glycoside hydrolase [Colwellia sp. UCD-KL20]
MKKNALTTYKMIQLATLLCTSLSFQSLAFNDDPLTTYIKDGEFVGNWKGNLSNSLNWNIPIVNQTGETERGNLVISPSTKKKENDAIRLKWKGKKVKNEWGGNILNDSSFTISKHMINIASIENQAALMVELKVNRSAKDITNISMQCNYSNKCLSKFSVKAILNRLPKGEWTQLPIPLNCFNKDGNFDFSKVTSIFSIGTQGKLDIEIANIGLVALPAGNKGCKAD